MNPDQIQWLSLIYCKIPAGTTPEKLRAAYIAAGWCWDNPKTEKPEPPPLPHLARFLSDTNGEWWVCGGLIWRRGRGHFVAQPIFNHLQQESNP